jgi:hypothetical protein
VSLGNPIMTSRIKIIEKYLAVVSDIFLRPILCLWFLISFIERKVKVKTVKEIIYNRRLTAEFPQSTSEHKMKSFDYEISHAYNLFADLISTLKLMIMNGFLVINLR